MSCGWIPLDVPPPQRVPCTFEKGHAGEHSWAADEAGPALPTRADLNASETPFDDLIAAYASVRRETFEACAKLCETWAREERVEVDGTTFVRNPVQVEAGRILASMIRTAADSVGVETKGEK